MRFLTEKQFRAIHEGHAFEVEYLNADLNVVRSERDYYREARARANDSAGLLRADRDRFIAERDEARSDLKEAINYQIHLQRGWGTANAALSEARAEIERLKVELAAVEQGNGRLFDQVKSLKAELDKLKAAYSVRPMGLGEMIADTLAKQADAALDSLDESGPKSWEPSDCIAGTPGCKCNTEVA